ncbi:MAG: hypothetical protein GX196_06265 [Clostridiaceae bacterium]|nr:hypothetical protein [Clostridiaceae bacterium]
MKKTCLLLLLVLFINIPVSSIANSNETVNTELFYKYKLIDMEGFENNDTVTRYECLVTIMKAIGVTEDIAIGGSGILASCFGEPSERAFFDGDGIGPGVDFVKYSYKITGYIDLAFYYYIAEGEFIGNRRYFYFDRPVTAKEAAAFMVRCLKGKDLGDLNKTFEIAKEMGLIKEEDVFYTNGDDFITPDYFLIMLQRFLNQPRYKYFDEDLYLHYGIDSERSMTYLQYLQSKQENTDNSINGDD